MQITPLPQQPRRFPSNAGLSEVHPFSARWRYAQAISEEWSACLQAITESPPSGLVAEWERDHIEELFCIQPQEDFASLADFDALVAALWSHEGDLIFTRTGQEWTTDQIDRSLDRLAFLLNSGPRGFDERRILAESRLEWEKIDEWRRGFKVYEHGALSDEYPIRVLDLMGDIRGAVLQSQVATPLPEEFDAPVMPLGRLIRVLRNWVREAQAAKGGPQPQTLSPIPLVPTASAGSGIEVKTKSVESDSTKVCVPRAELEVYCGDRRLGLYSRVDLKPLHDSQLTTVESGVPVDRSTVRMVKTPGNRIGFAEAYCADGCAGEIIDHHLAVRWGLVNGFSHFLEVLEPKCESGPAFTLDLLEEHFQTEEQQQFLRPLIGGQTVSTAEMIQSIWGSVSKGPEWEKCKDNLKKRKRRVNSRFTKIAGTLGAIYEVICHDGFRLVRRDPNESSAAS